MREAAGSATSLVQLRVGAATLLAVSDARPARGDQVFACIRGEDVIIERRGPSSGSARNHLAGVVVSIEPEGPIDEEELKVEYRAIAERRVRLGLLLAEVGRNHNITVTPDEINRALTERARQFPGQERRVIEYYRNHPEAIDQIRAPMFEDKVIDFILERAEVTERRVPVAELLKDEEDEETAAKPEDGEAKEAKAKSKDDTEEAEAAEEREGKTTPKKVRGKKKS